MTFSEFWQEYMDKYSKPRNKPRSIQEDEKTYRNYLVPERKAQSPLQNNVIQYYNGLEDSRPKGFDRLFLPYLNRFCH